MQFETYPFEKLNSLLKDITPNRKYSPISLTIGEPQFETPSFIKKALCENSSFLNKYPKSAGEELLKEAQKEFVSKRFGIELENEQIIPTFGTREVLFNFPQFFLHDKKDPVMAFTNPFYQIYEGAAIASGAKIEYINLTKENNFKAVIDEKVLKTCDLVVINFPNNPTASSMEIEELEKWVKAALKYDFVLLNDECYSELYTKVGDPSLLEASKKAGNEKFKNILVVNSISKRSSAPGLRSGFIAGDSTILKEYQRYRTYVGCAIPLPLQYAAAAAWKDEKHSAFFRKLYEKNLKLSHEILGIKIPKSTFYIWFEVDDDLSFTKSLYKEKNLKVLPGSFLSRGEQKERFVRIALVEDEAKTKDALTRIKSHVK